MGFKVFDLQCDTGHVFEGWFRSHEDYDGQQASGLVECPMCQSAVVTRMPSAPRLNIGRGHEPQQTSDSESESAPQGEQVLAGANQEVARLQAAMLQRVREFIQSTEDVGGQFAQEARRIHEGQAQERPIRGVATAQEREELAQDGIAVVALPDFLDNDRTH